MYTKLAWKIRNCQLHRPRKPHIPRFAHRSELTHSAVPSLQTATTLLGRGLRSPSVSQSQCYVNFVPTPGMRLTSQANGMDSRKNTNAKKGTEITGDKSRTENPNQRNTSTQS